ncbi:hypothetical protein [Psychroflexus montanilacus]|uniref:hypothetical protein n=1 Tax=Psychroflexus montanilacus TaxID=2873598 RepID=UPI001CCDB2DF|nr:hypothetical protein [Psychroflexus montanilacus]MBZ9650912.1 hypothetical protein [Psychroflexus montanilacus]
MSQAKNQIKTLDDTVTCLKHRSEFQFTDLKKQLSKTVDDYKPVNIIKEVVKDLGGSAIQKNNILETPISLMGGYFLKKIVVGKSKTLTRTLVGYALQFVVSNFISKKLNTITTHKKTINNT